MKPYTRETLAEYLSCSVDQVDYLRKTGKIKALKLGKREGIRFTQQAVEEFLEKCALSNTGDIGQLGGKGSDIPFVQPNVR